MPTATTPPIISEWYQVPIINSMHASRNPLIHPSVWYQRKNKAGLKATKYPSLLAVPEKEIALDG
jgi:hypothetical protein